MVSINVPGHFTRTVYKILIYKWLKLNSLNTNTFCNITVKRTKVFIILKSKYDKKKYF